MSSLEHSSPCGIYDQAIEASAEKLMLAARESSSSGSGYASDSDTLGSQESGGDLASISSSSPSHSTSSEYSEDESIESEIAYLQQKQSLLERALCAMKREEIYDASKALDVVNGRVPPEAPIWNEAKEVMDILNTSDENCDENGKRSNSSCSGSQSRKCSKRPRIDVSSVICQSSTDMDKTPSVISSYDRRVPDKQVMLAGHWIAQAMAQAMSQSFSPSNERCQSPSMGTTWEVMNDPDLGPLVVPPSKFEFKNELQLKDALSFTPNSQLITLSTPPFFVVHANKAFSIFSGLQNGDVVGKPIDTVVQVMNDLEQFPSASSCSAKTLPRFSGQVLGGSGKACRLVLTPISDHYRNPQRWISHLLVKVEKMKSSKREESSNFDLTEIVQKAVPTSPRHSANHHGFGTVG